VIRTIETSKERKANLVAEVIKKMILEENIEKLPGENKLAENFNVSRTIVREALRLLELEGITKTIHGSGTYVIKKNGLNISFNISLKVKSDEPKDILELLEVRRCLESGAIRLAVFNATEEQLNELRFVFSDLEKSIESHERLAETDERFHRKIFEIANNKILLSIFEILFPILSILWRSPLGLTDFGDRGLPYHRELCEAILSRDLPRALQAYERIIELDVEDVKNYVRTHEVKEG